MSDNIDIPQNFIRQYEMAEGRDRIAVLRKVREHLEKEGYTKDQIQQGLKNLRSASKSSSQTITGSDFYKKLGKLQIEDKNGSSIGQREIQNGIAGIRLTIRNPDMEIFNKAVESLTVAMKNQYPNIEPSLKKIKAAIKRQESVQRSRTRSKLIRIDKRRFLGANDLSYATKRQEVYDFWADTSKRYLKVEKTLRKLIREAKDADMFTELREKTESTFDEKLSGEEDEEEKRLIADQKRDALREIDRKRREYGEQLQKVEELSEKPLEYIVKSGKISSRFEKDPLERVLAGIARYEFLERKLEFREAEEGDETESDESQRAWEAALLEEAEARQADDIFSGATTQDATLVGSEEEDKGIDYDLVDSEELLNSEADPLLAIEILNNKKLLAIEPESIQEMKEVLDEIKSGATYINFVSYLDQMAEELEESIVLDQDEYILPIYTYQKLESILNNKKFTTATKNETIILGEDVKENLEALFQAIHLLFTDERFAFMYYPQDIGNQDKNVRSDAARMIRNNPSMSKKNILRIFTQKARQSPRIPPKEGVLLSGLDDSDVGKALGEFTKACSEYYFEPFTKGLVAGAYPRFLQSEGAKAVTTIANKLGYNTVMGQFSQNLTQIASVKITGGQMKSLADFLTTLDEPAVVVDDALVGRAEKAARVLTSIFGKEQENLNTVSAILKHYIEETDSEEMASLKIKGETINARSKRFYNKPKRGLLSYPIFALPFYLEANRGLFNREGLKTQYERLVAVLEDVEDDIPEVLNKLLKAHNEIRKALGKPVVYGMLAPTYRSYDRMIDYMHQEEGIDLSHLEVENIVKAVDSHANIGKEYGITEEQVYLIKANFR